MTSHGLNRLTPPTFGLDEAQTILDLITDGRSVDADDQLRHWVHQGVPPTQLFEAAMALQRQQDEAG